MLNKEDLRQISNLLDEKLDEKFEANNSILRAEMVQSSASLLKETSLGIMQLRGEMAQNITLLREQMKLDHAELNARFAHVETDIAQMKTEVIHLNLAIDNEIRPRLHQLIEVFLPESKRFSKAADDIHAIKSDITLLNVTVSKHSDMLNQLSAT